MKAYHFEQLPKILDAIEQADNVVILGHISPDVDAVCSALALAYEMKNKGKKVNVYFHDPISQRILSLLRIWNLCKHIEISSNFPNKNFDLLLIVDTATQERAGPAIRELRKLANTTINIDHHISNDMWAELNLVDNKAAASAEVVYNVLLSLCWHVSVVTANLLLAGILDDTGSFRYSSTSSNTLRISSDLLDKGANIALISDCLYYSVPEREIRLRSESLQNLELYFDGKLALAYVNREMLERNNCSSEETGAIVDLARAIEGVQVSVFLRETDTDWKLSMRSKSFAIDVNEIAQNFGGGGHKAAAGCRISGKLEDVKSHLLSSFANVFKTH